MSDCAPAASRVVLSLRWQDEVGRWYVKYQYHAVIYIIKIKEFLHQCQQEVGDFFVNVVKEWPPRWSEWHTISKPSFALLCSVPCQKLKHRKHGFGHGLASGIQWWKLLFCPFALCHRLSPPRRRRRCAACAAVPSRQSKGFYCTWLPSK